MTCALSIFAMDPVATHPNEANMARNIKADKVSDAPSSGTGKADQTIGTKPIRTFNGPSLKPSNVGPAKAPYYDNSTQK